MSNTTVIMLDNLWGDVFRDPKPPLLRKETRLLNVGSVDTARLITGLLAFLFDSPQVYVREGSLLLTGRLGSNSHLRPSRVSGSYCVTQHR